MQTVDDLAINPAHVRSTRAAMSAQPAADPVNAHPYIPCLDGLRAVAVLAVIAFHFGASIDGAAGVTVFFALSGYLITDLLINERRTRGRISISNFYRRRIRRLLPASTCAVILTMAVVVIKDLPPIGRQAQAALLYWTNWERFDSHVAYGQPTFAPLTHFWSLAIEEQFYVAFPLVAMVALRFGRRALAATCALLCTGSALWAHTLADDPLAYYHTGTRVAELLLGAFVACIGLRLPRWFGHVALVVLLMTIVLFSAPHLVIAAMTVVVIAGRPSVLAARPLPAIGRVSYGLYLFHPISLIIAEGSIPVATAIMVALTLVSYFALERPLRFRLSWPHARTAILALSALAVTMALLMAPRPQHRPFALVAESPAPVLAATTAATATAATAIAPPPTPTPTHDAVTTAALAHSPPSLPSPPPASADAVSPAPQSDVSSGTTPSAVVDATTLAPATSDLAPPAPPIRISMAGDSTSPAIGQALAAWAALDPAFEFIPAPPSADGWADWPEEGLGRGACGLMHHPTRGPAGEIVPDGPDRRDNVDDSEHVGCNPYKWIPQALATMDLDVLVVSWSKTQRTEFLIEGEWSAPGTPAYDAAFVAAMDFFEGMAAQYETKVLWLAYPDTSDDRGHYVDLVGDLILTRGWNVDLRPMSRDADETPLYYDEHHFTAEAAAEAVAIIVPTLVGGPPAISAPAPTAETTVTSS